MATTLEELQVLITAETADLRKELGNVKKDLGGLDKQAKDSAASITKAFSAVKTALIALGIGKLIKDSINAASELEGAMAGLTSIVEGHGMSMQRANKFIQDYIKDGLVPLTNAVTAYKNLAARGYTEDQIQNVMSRLKDSAAFGRQASYSLGQAVESATEGLKNENSILVDNAGVTKNVAKMWEDYAKAQGKSYNELTQQEKIQAEVNGIMQETQFQVGDAAKYADTYAGRLAALNKTLYDIKVSLGQAFMPIMNVILPLLQTLANAVARVMSYVAQFMQALFGVAKGQQAQAASANKAAAAQVNVGDSADKAGKKAKKAAKEARGAVLAFDEINQLPDKSGSSGSDSSGGGGAGGGAGNLGALELPGLDPAEVNVIPKEIQQMADKVKGILLKIFEPIKKAWDQYGPGVTEEFKRAIEGWKQMWKGSGEIFGSIWDNGGAKLVENITGLALEMARLALRIYNDFILPIVNWFNDFLNPETNKATKGILDGVNWLLEKLKEFVSYLAGDGFGYVQIALGALLGAFVALKVYETVLGIIEFIKGVTVAAKALFVVLAANPIGLVITAIGLLVGAFIALYNNNETFRNAVDKLWAQLKSALIPVFETLKEVAINVWNNALVPLGEFLGRAFVASWEAVTKASKFLWNEILVPFGDFLKWLWNSVISPLAGVLADAFAIAFNTVSEAAGPLWQNVLVPLGEFLMTVFLAAVQGTIDILTTWWNNILKPLAAFIAETFKPIVEALIDVFVFLWHNVFEPIAKYMAGEFLKTFKNITSGIGTIIKGLQEIFVGLITFITGVFTGDWAKAWDGIKMVFKGVFDSLYGIVKVPLNMIIDAINWVIDGLNKIQISLPDWDIMGDMKGKNFGINIGHINKLARGGIVDSPQLAMIGEAGKEAVVPLENTSFVNTLASALGTAVMGAMQMSGGGQQAATGGDVIIQVDGTTLARVLNPYLSREQGRLGSSIIQPI